MTNVRSFIVGLVVLILLFAGGIYAYQRSIKPTILKRNAQASPTPAKFNAVASPTPSPTAQVNQATNVAIAPSTGSDPQNIGISIQSPKPQSKITSPVTITGRANVEDAVVNLVVLDANRMVLGSSKVFTCMAEDACPFTQSVSFTAPLTTNGTIELYANATTNNPQPNLQVINVNF